jgi:DNA-binding CsgD family transcriptional regulator
MEVRVIETAREALFDLEEYLAESSAATRRFTRRSADLTDKEREVLGELAAGLTTDEAAQALHVSPHTVRSRVKNALRKMGAKTREQAVAIAIREGAIEVEL